MKIARPAIEIAAFQAISLLASRRHVGAHLDFDLDEAAVGYGYTSLVSSDLLVIGRAAYGLHH